MNEKYYDALLNIKTGGDQKGFHQSLHYHRYEPTPYSALEHLFTQHELESSDRIVDFGCGKGRLNFYIHHLFSAHVTGIEMDENFYREALENRKSYQKKNRHAPERIQFQCTLAQNYEIHPADNVFYFFNPFSVQIFMGVVKNILQSVEENKREIELILYYGSEDYTFFLENQTAFELREQVLLPGLYESNPFEKFLIYRLAY
ncbi:SAM-dependent methyltransferase [Peribacillus sp. B-H-3]|jgi:SAM-dependent methyltransferase|uniref:SAM-dependent methyltransferase n=1 Tax=Peribacillus sp. B-H-3 TaxID=3400420 RepID=UPI003B01C8D2